MSKLIFLIEEAPEGGYITKGQDQSIFTEADDLESLRTEIKSAVNCHFEKQDMPKILRLKFVREEVITI